MLDRHLELRISGDDEQVHDQKIGRHNASIFLFVRSAFGSSGKFLAKADQLA